MVGNDLIIVCILKQVIRVIITPCPSPISAGRIACLFQEARFEPADLPSLLRVLCAIFYPSILGAISMVRPTCI
jgi:hypothetical protein